MASLNHVRLIGHAGADPEIRRTPEGVPVAAMRLATSRRWKDKRSNELVEETEWHRLVAFDRLAEVIEKYVSKGSFIAADGRLKTRKWQDKDGNDRYTTEIILNDVLLLDKRGDSGDTASTSADGEDDSPI